MENSSLTTFPSLKLGFIPDFSLYHSSYPTHQEILLALSSKYSKHEPFCKIHVFQVPRTMSGIKKVLNNYLLNK